VALDRLVVTFMGIMEAAAQAALVVISLAIKTLILPLSVLLLVHPMF
jgi:hypothetical protein